MALALADETLMPLHCTTRRPEHLANTTSCAVCKEPREQLFACLTNNDNSTQQSCPRCTDDNQDNSRWSVRWSSTYRALCPIKRDIFDPGTRHTFLSPFHIWTACHTNMAFILGPARILMINEKRKWLKEKMSAHHQVLTQARRVDWQELLITIAKTSIQRCYVNDARVTPKPWDTWASKPLIWSCGPDLRSLLCMLLNKKAINFRFMAHLSWVAYRMRTLC